MKIPRKLELAAQAINSIARHDDAEEALVLAALDQLAKHISVETAAAKARRQARRAAALAELQATADKPH